MYNNETIDEMIQEEYVHGVQNGIQLGILLMKEKLLRACENGTPIEINGKVYFLKSDIENLRDIFADIENAAEDDFC